MKLLLSMLLALPCALASMRPIDLLMDAVYRGNLVLLSENRALLLDLLSQRACDARCFLHHAVRHNQLDIVGKCGELGANLSAVCFSELQDTPLHVAVALKNVNMMTVLLEAGADADAYDNQGHSPTMIACKSGDDETTQFLCDDGADLSGIDETGKSLLHCLASQGLEGSLGALFFAGSIQSKDLEKRDVLGYYPAAYAAENGHRRIAAKLLEATFDASAAEIQRTKSSLLFDAVHKNWAMVVDLILSDFGGDVNAQDENGNTGLHYAVHWNNRKMVNTFLRYQPNLMIKNAAGKTVLDQHNAKFYPYLTRAIWSSDAKEEFNVADGEPPRKTQKTE